MKNFFFTGLFLIIGFTAVAQLNQEPPKYRYKDLLPMLSKSSIDEQSTLLWEYILADLDHPNANFRLAKLHYDIFRKTDPLVQYEKAMGQARESSLRLMVARKLVTEQEVRTNDEFYSPLFNMVDSKGRPTVDFPAVQKKMQTIYDSTIEFRAKMPPIYTAFTKSVNNYDRAVKLFSKLNTDYKTLEDIFMLYNDDMDLNLSELKSLYDSSVFYFDQYLLLTKSYTLKQYKHKYHIKPVEIYRLDGLTTRLNFLTTDVEFWNYGAWVDRVKAMYTKEVAGLKEKIEVNDAKISEVLIGIPKPENTLKAFKLDKDVVFKLNNYDKNSLALALLEYKSFKQHWLLRTKAIGSDSSLDIKMELYSDLIRMNRTADSLCRATRSQVNPLNLRKHKDLLDKHYGGDAGLEKFIHDESEWIEATYHEYQEILKGTLFASTQSTDLINIYHKHNAYNIPLFIQKKSVNLLDNTSLQTLRQMRSPDGSLYVAGVHRLNKKTNTLTAYVARVSPDGKSAWMKEFSFKSDSIGAPNEDNYVGDLALTQEGCALVVSSVAPGRNKVINTFVYLTEKGEEKRRAKLKEDKLCRKIIYQESSNTLIMAFKGLTEYQEYQTEEPISISSINVLSDMVWRKEISLAGTIQDVVPVRDGYVVVGNFTAIRDLTGNPVRTKLVLAQSNPYLIKLSSKGEIMAIDPLETPKSVYVETIIKVNDGSINLLGYESSFTTMKDPTSLKGRVVHMMVGHDLKKVCSDF